MSKTQDRNTGFRATTVAWVLCLGAVLAMLGGCAPMQFETGRKFEPAVLEQSLRTGESTQADVKRTLGEPFGTGRALMPFHESPRTVWTYSYQRGSINMGSGESESDMLLLFVFFDGEKYDGYIWGGGKMASAKPR